MARKWYLFYRRIQLFLKKKISLLMIFLLSLTLIFIMNKTEKIIAKNSENIIAEKLFKNNIFLTKSEQEIGERNIYNNFFDNEYNRNLIVNNIESSGDNLLNLGLQLYKEGKFNQAKKEWLKAELEYRQKNDKFNRALVLNYLSLVHQKLGEWVEAQRTINQSFQLVETEINIPQNYQKSAIFARIFNTKGKLLLTLGKLELALENLQRGEIIYRQLNDTEGVIISQLNQAIALQKLGRFRDNLSLLNNLQKDLENQSDAIKIKGLISLAKTFKQVGELEKSLNILTETLTLAEKNQSPLFVSNTLIELGNTQRAIGNQEIELLSSKTDFFVPLVEQKTMSNFESALSSYQKVIEIGIPDLKLQAQLNKLSLLADITQFSFTQAEKLQVKIPLFLQEFTQEASNFWKTIKLPSKSEFITQNSVYSYINLADSLIRFKSNSEFLNDISWSEIEALLQEAIIQAQNLEDQRAESEALGKIGRIAEINQDWQNAQKLTEKALLRSQSLNANEISYKWLWQLGRIKYQQNERQDAIKNYSQAINILKTLRSDLLAVSSDLEFNFRENVEPVYRELVSILLQQEATALEIKQARDVIEDLQVAELNNFFRVACVETKPILIDQITEKQDPTAAVIYTIVLSDRLEIILKLPKENIRHYTVPLNDLPKIERLLQRLAQSLTQRNSQETLPLAQQAYDLLIRPLEQDLATSKVKTLVFVLDSPLRNVPMSVLHDGQQYLVEKYGVVLSPGLQLIEPQSIASQELKALTAGLTEARGGFPALNYVVDELNTIQSQISTTELLLDSDFTNTAFQDKIDQLSFSIVHLATHGQFSSQAENTFILTWNDRINVNQLNSLLRSRDSRGKDALELLVLSACETLTGDRRATLGLAGIAVRAGTRSTLATLWRINDEASALLMGQFYQQLTNQNTHSTKAEALRQAQLSLLKDSRFNRPYFWASYVLVGNWL